MHFLFFLSPLVLTSAFGKAVLKKQDGSPLCSVPGNPYSVTLNTSSASEAASNCANNQLALATLSSSLDLIRLSSLLFECSLLTGQPLDAAWINPEQSFVHPNVLGGKNDCLAVDARGGLMAGTPHLCKHPFRYAAICQPPASHGTINSNSGNATFVSSANNSTFVSGINGTLIGDSIINANATSYVDSETTTGSASDFNNTNANTDRSGENIENEIQLINELLQDNASSSRSKETSSSSDDDNIINIDYSDDSLTTPLPTPIPSDSNSSTSSSSSDSGSDSGSNSSGKPSEPSVYHIAPFQLLGYKLVTNKLPYNEAEAACNSLGMRLASVNFVTHWLAALVIYQGSYSRSSLAWIDSHPAMGHQKGCIALRAASLSLTGPRVEAQHCMDRLPALCQGPLMSSWHDVIDVLQNLENLFRFLPGVENFQPIMPLLQNNIQDLAQAAPFPRLPDMEALLDGLHLKSANNPATVIAQEAHLQIVKLNRKDPSSACIVLGLKDADLTKQNFAFTQKIAKQKNIPAVLFQSSGHRHIVYSSGVVYHELFFLSHNPLTPQYIACSSN